MPVVRTLGDEAQVEIPKIKGSRFVAWAARADTEDAARRVLAKAQQAWSDASHHCWAWRGPDGEHRSSDDGEPNGTAGAPILQRIDGHDLTSTFVVVARWFGGTKLGTGGLVRAYGDAAAAALDQAPVVEERVGTTLSLTVSYEDTGAVQSVLSAFEGEVRDAEYTDRVVMRVWVPVEHHDRLLADLSERTAGRVRPDEPPR